MPGDFAGPVPRVQLLGTPPYMLTLYFGTVQSIPETSHYTVSPQTWEWAWADVSSANETPVFGSFTPVPPSQFTTGTYAQPVFGQSPPTSPAPISINGEFGSASAIPAEPSTYPIPMEQPSDGPYRVYMYRVPFLITGPGLPAEGCLYYLTVPTGWAVGSPRLTFAIGRPAASSSTSLSR